MRENTSGENSSGVNKKKNEPSLDHRITGVNDVDIFPVWKKNVRRRSQKFYLVVIVQAVVSTA